MIKWVLYLLHEVNDEWVLIKEVMVRMAEIKWMKQGLRHEVIKNKPK